MTDSIVLIWLLAVLFIGGLFCWLSELAGGIRYPRWIALGTMVLALLITLWLWASGDYSLSGIGAEPKWALEFQRPWIERFGISFHLGLDGLSLLLIVLTGLLGLMAVACSWKEITKNTGFFYLNLLWNLGGVVGVFLALDLFLFFFFWEMMLVPMYFLIAIWGHDSPGGRGRIYAATKFFIFTQASGLFMLLAILGLVWANHQGSGAWSFDYEVLLNTGMSDQVQWLLMLGFFLAFMVKLPVVPFHSWLPDAHSQAPTAGSAVLAGILLKTAAYGMMRFALPLFPEASASFAPVAMSLGVTGIVYGAFMTFAQNNIKRLVAYSSVSHMGFVLVGIYAGTEQALQGAIITIVAHGISAGALFILCGGIYARIHTLDLREMGGLWARFPYLPPIMMFFALAALGLPGLGNFVGEFLVLVGTWPVNQPMTIFAASGMVLAAVYSLIMVQRAFHGPAKTDEKLHPLDGRELATCITLMAVLLWLGVYPQPVLDTSAATMQSLHTLYVAAGGGP